MGSSYVYRNLELIGYRENVNFDGMQFTVGVLNSSKDDYLFTESISITGTSIVILFGQRNGEKALNYIAERAYNKAKARIDSVDYETAGKYIERIDSESLKKSRDTIDEQFINIKILTSLHNIRKINSIGFKNDGLELEGFCILYQVTQESVFYLLSILEEKQFINITDMNNAQMYITIDGINYLDTISKVAHGNQQLEQIEVAKIWDVFISHASEDKQDVVEPLAMELKKYGISVWYDKWSLKLGDSLRKKIDEGLQLSKFGIVVLSPAFINKHWTNLELAGLFQREAANSGGKVILPIWHNLSPKEVTQFSPMLSDKLAISTNQGITRIAKQLAEVILETEIEGKAVVNDLTYLDFDITFKQLHSESTGEVHIYDLLVVANLKCPPVLKTFRLCILWPDIVTITKFERFRKGLKRVLDNEKYTEYWYDRNDSIFPGEKVEIISPNSPYQIQYIINNDIWRRIKIGDLELRIIIYFEDLMPEEVSKNYNQLNQF